MKNSKAILTYEEYIKKYPNTMIYDNKTDNYYSELEDLLQEIVDNLDPINLEETVKTLDLHGTTEVTMGITHEEIINYIEEKYEEVTVDWDSYELSKRAVQGAKKLVDNFNENYADKTYWEDPTIKIELSKLELQYCLDYVRDYAS